MRLFDSANIYITKGISSIMNDSSLFGREVITSSNRFKRLDYGETSPEDILVNNDALNYKDRVIGVYCTSETNIWIIAESEDGNEYTVLTVLLPDEY